MFYICNKKEYNSLEFNLSTDNSIFPYNMVIFYSQNVFLKIRWLNITFPSTGCSMKKLYILKMHITFYVKLVL